MSTCEYVTAVVIRIAPRKKLKELVKFVIGKISF